MRGIHGALVALAALLTGCAEAAVQGGGEDVQTSAAALTASTHESDAEQLVVDLEASGLDVYGSSPTYITWAGSTSAARTVCSTFMTLLLEHSYAWTGDTFKTWMGSSSPTAAVYHDTIAAADGFTPVATLDAMTAGDILAIKYLDGSTSTGHVALLAGAPRLRNASAPLVDGTTQYEVDVIDSAQSNHGNADTRLLPDGTSTSGIGKGVMRLYAGPDGTIAGYTWSTYSSSVYYSMSVRHAVVGRLL